MSNTVYTPSTNPTDSPFSDPKGNPISANIPILLFPIRIELRYTKEDSELLLRFFPDDIIVEDHDPRLTLEEYNAFQAYQSTESPEQKQSVWRDMVGRFGVNRSKWIIFAKDHLDIEASIDFENEHLKYCRLLPERFIVQLYDEEGKYKEFEGNPIISEEVATYITKSGRKTIQGLNILNNDPIEIAKSKDWLFNFEKALEIGMGMRIKLGEKKVFKKLIAFGVKSSWDPRKSKQHTEELFQSQEFTQGFSFLPYGTPTNNTSSSNSGYDPARNWETEESYLLNTRSIRKNGKERNSFRSRSNGDSFAHLLGLDSSIFQHIEGANLDENPLYRHAQEISWNIWGGYMLDLIINHHYDDDLKQAIWVYFCDYVSARGPLSSIRVQQQPYGVLPIISLSEVAKDFDSFESKLARILLALRTSWEKIFEESDAETQIPRLRLDLIENGNTDTTVEEQVSAVLAMSPGSKSLKFTPVNDGGGETLKTYALFAGLNDLDDGVNAIRSKYKDFVIKKFASVKKTSNLVKEILRRFQSGVANDLSLNEDVGELISQFLDIQSPESQFLELFPYGKPLNELRKKKRKEQNAIVQDLKNELRQTVELVKEMFLAFERGRLDAFFEGNKFKSLWIGTARNSKKGTHLISEIIHRSLKYLGRFFELNEVHFPNHFPAASYEPDALGDNYQYIVEEIHVQKGQYVRSGEKLISILISQKKNRLIRDIGNVLEELIGNSPAYVAWKTEEDGRFSETVSLSREQFKIDPAEGLSLRKFRKRLGNAKSVHRLEIAATQSGIIDDLMVRPLAPIVRGERLLTFRRGIDKDQTQVLNRYRKAFLSLESIILAPMNDSLEMLEAFEQGIRECLDVSTYRLDAWITSLATSRLDKVIRKGKRDKGLFIGCYAYLENLNPDYGKAGEGEFIHAPSVEQAQNLAIARQAFNNGSLPEQTVQEEGEKIRLGNPAAVYLTSERVQVAKRINEGLRNKRSSAEILGGIFREEMFRAGKRKEYTDFSRRYPLLVDEPLKAEGGGEPTETEKAKFDIENLQQVDGLRLLSKAVFNQETSASKEREDKTIVDIIKKLRSSYDGKFDLDGMEYRHYSLINRNPEYASSIVSAFEGKKGLERYDSIRTKRNGIKYTSRFVSLFTGSLDNSFQNPKAIAEPRLEQWLAEQIGRLVNIEFGVSVKFQKGKENPKPVQISRKFVNLAELQFGYLDLLEICKQSVSNKEEDSTIQLRTALFLYLSESLPIEEDKEDRYIFLIHPSTTSDESEKKSLKWALGRLRVIKDYLSKTSPALPQDLLHPALLSEKLFSLSTRDVIAQYEKLEHAFVKLEELSRSFSVEDPTDPIFERISTAASFGVPAASFIHDAKLEDQVINIKSSLANRVKAFDTFREQLLRKFPFLNTKEYKAIELDAYETAFKDITTGFSILFSQSQKTATKLTGSNDPKPPFPISYEITAPERFLEIQQLDSRYTLKGQQKEINQRITDWVQQKAETSAAMASFELYKMQADPDRLKFGVLQYQPQVKDTIDGSLKDFKLGKFPWMSLADAEIKEVIKQPGVYSADEKSKIVLDNKAQRPRGIFSLVTFQSQNHNNTVGGLMAARSLQMDNNDADFIPSNIVNTGISFYNNSPNSEAPQSLLLAVPHKGQSTWNHKNLSSLLNETFELAKTRLVDPNAINAADIYLPAAFLPVDTDYDQREPGKSVLAPRRMGPSAFNAIITQSNSVFKLDEKQEGLPISQNIFGDVVLDAFLNVLNGPKISNLKLGQAQINKILEFINVGVDFTLNELIEEINKRLSPFALGLITGYVIVPLMNNLNKKNIRIYSNKNLKKIDDDSNPQVLYSGLKLKKIDELDTYGIYFQKEGITIELAAQESQKIPLEQRMLLNTNRVFRFKMGVERKSYTVRGLDISSKVIYSKEIQSTKGKMVTLIVSGAKLKYIQITGSGRGKKDEAFILPQSLI